VQEPLVSCLFGIGPVGITNKIQRMGVNALRELSRAISPAPRFVKAAEEQTGAAERAVSPPTMLPERPVGL